MCFCEVFTVEASTIYESFSFPHSRYEFKNNCYLIFSILRIVHKLVWAGILNWNVRILEGMQKISED